MSWRLAGTGLCNTTVVSLLLRFCCFGLTIISACAAEQISLDVPAGAPLRVYLNSRLTTHVGRPVSATLLDPIYSFDRIVIPAGSVVEGHITRLLPVSRWRRASAILNGDFTPLARPEVRFELVRLTSGSVVPIATMEALPLDSVFRPARPSKHKRKASSGSSQSAIKREIYSQINGQINNRSRGVSGVVLGPDRLENLEELLVARLPWHPQWVRKGTRFDAELEKSLSFGNFSVPEDARAGPAPTLPPDASVHARLLTVLDSHSSKAGDPVLAVLTEPLFSADRHMLLPEGTRLTGSVKLARPARMFHRGGRLRFTFEKLEVPAGRAAASLGSAARPTAIHAQVAAVEQSTGAVEVDAEGQVKATESKTRFLGPVLAGIAAAQTHDENEHGRSAEGGNRGGLALGGFSGLGLLGSALSQSSQSVGQALGYWGLGVSIYTNVVSRGQEVIFEKNHSIDVVFNPQRPAVTASHLSAGTD